VANAGDSLTAIKKLVFEDKTITLPDLKKASMRISKAPNNPPDAHQAGSQIRQRR
jgi:hypothetical protein